MIAVSLLAVGWFLVGTAVYPENGFRIFVLGLGGFLVTYATMAL